MFWHKLLAYRNTFTRPYQHLQVMVQPICRYARQWHRLGILVCRCPDPREPLRDPSPRQVPRHMMHSDGGGSGQAGASVGFWRSAKVELIIDLMPDSVRAYQRMPLALLSAG
jgi:hypothetical protein